MGGIAKWARWAAAPTGTWALSLVLASACAPGIGHDASRALDRAPSSDLHVLVAASLLRAAETLAREFEHDHPGARVRLAAAGSSALREQVLAGAPADVFIPANPAHLDIVDQEIGLVGEPVIVAHNSLVLAVPSGNPAGVSSLRDLSRPELLIGLCAAEVPCGALARRGLALAGIVPAPDTDEPNARALVAKLAAGELDAAVTYASDTVGGAGRGDAGEAGDGSVVPIVSLGWPAAAAPRTSYAAGVIAETANLGAAEAFVEFLQTAGARDILVDHGFGTP